jgi:uncharacterized protein (TIGR03435 family)
MRINRPQINANKRELLALGMFGRESRIGDRIVRLLERGQEFSTEVSRARVAIGGAMLLGCLIVAAIAPRTFAFAQEQSRFDVVSVRPIPGPVGFHNTVLYLAHGTWNADFAALRQMVGLAYGIQRVRVEGGPTWADSDLFRITAKTDKVDAGVDELRFMAQAVLADRFKLAVHRERKQLSGFTLVVGKNGSKLEESKEHGTPVVEQGEGEGVTLVFHHWPIGGLVNYLANVLDGPVQDGTALTGEYEFRLDHAPFGDVRPSSAPSLFAAVEDQLGLRLESGKVLEDVLVIEHAEKPDAN